MKFTIATAALFILTTSGILSYQEQDSLRSFISKECDYLLTNREISSLSVGVIKDGKIYKFHKGKLINGKSPNDQTLYEIASLTKTFIFNLYDLPKTKCGI